MRKEKFVSAEKGVQSARLHSLDGLRGIAALIVLIHHSLLTIPALADPYYSDVAAKGGSVEWWLIHTPLHLLWEGKAAVYIFFILSGIVLTLPVLKASSRYSWRAFYPQRIVRLYLPVWGSVALAAIVFWLLPRQGVPNSEWLLERPKEMDSKGILESLTLIASPGGLISPLWSLQWEVLFSIVVPIYIWFALKFQRWPFLIGIGCVVVSSVGGALEESILIYPPMFMLGAVIAVRLDHIRKLSHGLSNRQWIALTLASAALMSAHWIALAFNPSDALLGSMIGPTLIGSALMVVAAIGWPKMSRTLTAPILLWLGTISFSLYLVHEPIVVGLGYLAGPNIWWSIPAGIFISLVVGHIFYRIIEKPSHNLAKKLKQRQMA